MKRISLLCFSQRGWLLGERVKEALEKAYPSAWITLEGKSQFLKESYPGRTQEWAGEHFSDDALLFLGAAGICVRSIAPFVKDKKTDPAVLCIDEGGRFVVPLLSGHVGGANDLSLLLADILEAQPVITTATDGRGCFAVDLFAKKNDCSLPDKEMGKKISAALLAGERVGLFSDFPLEGEIPEGMIFCDEKGHEIETEQGNGSTIGNSSVLPLGIAVTARDITPFPETCLVIPPVLVLGMGCKAGTAKEMLLERVEKDLKGYRREALVLLCSIDKKAQEEGLLALARDLQLPFQTFSAQALQEVKGEYSSSAFVEKTVGVGNVCERAAMAGGGKGALLIIQKQAGEGITLALAQRERRLVL